MVKSDSAANSTAIPDSALFPRNCSCVTFGPPSCRKLPLNLSSLLVTDVGKCYFNYVRASILELVWQAEHRQWYRGALEWVIGYLLLGLIYCLPFCIAVGVLAKQLPSWIQVGHEEMGKQLVLPHETQNPIQRRTSVSRNQRPKRPKRAAAKEAPKRWALLCPRTRKR